MENFPYIRMEDIVREISEFKYINIPWYLFIN